MAELVMALVFQSEHLEIITPEHPPVSRGDGEHFIINPRVPAEDRTRLSREQAIELMKLTMVAGEAMKDVLTRRGIETLIVRLLNTDKYSDFR